MNVFDFLVVFLRAAPLGYDNDRFMLNALVKKRALEIGFDLVGIAPVEANGDLKFSREWVERGYGGEMRYLENPKRDDPRRILPSAQSVICVGLIYNADRPYSVEVRSHESGARTKKEEEAQQDKVFKIAGRNSKAETGHSSLATSNSSVKGDHGWISRYAWGTDYHHVMRAKLEQLRTAVEELAPGTDTRVYVDTGPIVERAFARLSGIGWTGKNTCLINQSKGSWFFLGVMLTSLALAPDLPAPDRCGSCTACIEACPTDALVHPYVMDASRCIAYLNIELKGSIPETFRSAIGANVVGCDICQDVCPWNGRRSQEPGVRSQSKTGDKLSAVSKQRRETATTQIPEFQPLQVQPSTTGNNFSLFNPSLEELASLDENDFRRIFRRSPIKRLKYRGWLRNICVAMGNSGDSRFLPKLQCLREHAEPVVREHADWGIAQIARAMQQLQSIRPSN